MYTNIPLEWGIEVLVEHYTETLKFWCVYDIDIKPIPPRLLKRILEFTLKNCYFSFNNCIYRQLQGLTMEGASSVQAANIIMFKFFQKFHKDSLNLYPDFKIWRHHRFIDNLFRIWNSNITEFETYFKLLNNYHPNFKFTLNLSKTDLPFLDVKVLKIKVSDTSNWTLGTTLYTKPTDRKLYLDFNSEHAIHIKQSIPFSQMLRLKRIISDELNLNNELDIMIKKNCKKKLPLKPLIGSQTQVIVNKPL